MTVRRESFAERIYRILNSPTTQNRSRNDEGYLIVSQKRKLRALSKTTKLYTPPRYLPRTIGSLDIETWKTNFRSPDKSELAVAGFRLYQLENGNYVSKGYRAYTRDNLNELQIALAKVHLILGHNILDFDYRVLSQWIRLEEVIEKTVDTYFFLWMKKKNRSGGLSLKNLCELNYLRTQKVDLGRSISTMWFAGDIDGIIHYNMNDCRITKELWWHMLTRRTLYISHEGNGGQKIRVTKEDFRHLLGRKPIYTYSSWIDSIQSLGNVWKSKSAKPFLEIADESIGDRQEQILLRVKCLECPRYFVFVTSYGHHWKKGKTVLCPGCGSSIKVASARSSYTSRFKVVKNLGGSPRFLDFLDGTIADMQDYVPVETARKFIQRHATRYWERWMPVQK